jgi:hypothetical protein
MYGAPGVTSPEWGHLKYGFATSARGCMGDRKHAAKAVHPSAEGIVSTEHLQCAGLQGFHMWVGT